MQRIIRVSPYTISAFIFYLFLRSISRKLFNVFIIFSFIVTCFVFPTLKIYGNIDLDYVNSVFYTNKQEALSYISITPLKVYVLLLLLGFFKFLIVRVKHATIISKKWKILFLIIFLLPPLRKIVKKEPFVPNYIYVLPAKLPYTFALYYNDVKHQHNFINREIKKVPTWEIISKPDTIAQRNVVVVIGESVRKDFLHSYGFPIENTPFIENSNNIQFNNVISAGGHTIPSLLRTISWADSITNYEMNNNIISLSKKIGYKTFWISNQGLKGVHDSPISVIGETADDFLCLNNQGYREINSFDDEMLPYFFKILEDKKPKLIVLHMYGSHVSACDRTGGVYDEFIGSEEISCYNKSIKNLDNFLEKVNSALVNTKQGFDMVYFSDHGMKLENNILSHGGFYQSNYDIPLILWSDRIKQSQQINAVRRSYDFLQLFSEITGVKTKNIKRNYTFASEDSVKNLKTDIILDDFTDAKLGNYKDLPKNPLSPLFEKE